MEASQDTGSKENPENNPDCTTVYVGNLGHEVNRDELHRHFYNLGVGAIEEVRVQQDKGFGFVRYSNHGEAALAIQMANGLVVRGKPIKVLSNSNKYYFVCSFNFLHDYLCNFPCSFLVLMGQQTYPTWYILQAIATATSFISTRTNGRCATRFLGS
jgi:RNA recognition motif-containing protein